MIIDFKNIEQNVMSQFKGGNGEGKVKLKTLSYSPST